MGAPFGDPAAERPWLLINPDDSSKGAWPGIPVPLLADGGTRLNSAWGRDAPQPFELGSLENGTGTLLVVESTRGLQTVADYFRHRAWSPTIVVVHEREPLPVVDALKAAARRGHPMRPGFVPPVPPFDLALIEPLVAAEVARGNGRPILEDERPHFFRQWMTFPYPIDPEAIRAEFDLGPGAELDARTPPWITFEQQPGRPDEFQDFPIGGAMRFTTSASRAKREHWWQEWRRNPRPRQRLVNPFSPHG